MRGACFMNSAHPLQSSGWKEDQTHFVMVRRARVCGCLDLPR